MVMPVANEEETIRDILNRILELEIDLKITPVIDDYSVDDTQKIIQSFEKKYPKQVKLLYAENSTCPVDAYLFGFKNALDEGVEYIIEMDAGNSHRPEKIPDFVDKLEEGYNCVFGTRFLEDGGFKDQPYYRVFLSWFGTKVANVYLGTNLTDMTSGFEAFKAEVLEELDFDMFLSSGHSYQTEMRYYCKDFNTTETPILYTGSESSFSSDSLIEAFTILFQLKKNYKKVKS